MKNQRNPNQSYLTSFVYEAKQGMTEKFESAAAKKTKMFNSEEGNTIWTYRVTSGPSQGQYVRFLINQSSEDYGQDSSEELEGVVAKLLSTLSAGEVLLLSQAAKALLAPPLMGDPESGLL